MEKISKTLFRYRFEIVILLFSSFLFFGLRFYNLKFLPIFVDEAIYVRWAQQGLYDPTLRLISLVDGKQPLYIWLVSILTSYIYNPLLAGRLVSIAAGFITLIGLFLLSFELFRNRWVSVISVLLYAFYPFALILNRMAIYESLIGMFAIWSLYVAILLVRYISLGMSLILGLVLGGSLLTKSSGFINIYLLPTVLLLFNFKKGNLQKLLKCFFLALLAIILSFLYYSVLLLSDKYYMISEKDAYFIYHLKELAAYHAFDKWVGNILLLLHWTFIYLTYPASLLLFLNVRKSYRKEKLLLLFWFMIPIIGIALFGRALTPRYIFPMTLFLLPIIAVNLKELYLFFKNRIVYGLIIILVIGFLTFSNYKILTDISHAPIPQEDLQQYVNGFSGGQGLREIISYLAEQAKKKQIMIASEGVYGSLPTTVVEIYFVHNTQVERYAFDVRPKRLPQELYSKAQTKPVYVIFNETQSVYNWPLELIMKFKRGSGDLNLSLYKVHSRIDSEI